MVRTEEKRPESQQETIDHRKIGCAFSRAADYQELLFHKQAVSNNGFCATRAQELGEGGQQMYE
jgi:hypothetical protein